MRCGPWSCWIWERNAAMPCTLKACSVAVAARRLSDGVVVASRAARCPRMRPSARCQPPPLPRWPRMTQAGHARTGTRAPTPCAARHAPRPQPTKPRPSSTHATAGSCTKRKALRYSGERWPTFSPVQSKTSNVLRIPVAWSCRRTTAGRDEVGEATSSSLSGARTFVPATSCQRARSTLELDHRLQSP